MIPSTASNSTGQITPAQTAKPDTGKASERPDGAFSEALAGAHSVLDSQRADKQAGPKDSSKAPANAGPKDSADHVDGNDHKDVDAQGDDAGIDAAKSDGTDQTDLAQAAAATDAADAAQAAAASTQTATVTPVIEADAATAVVEAVTATPTVAAPVADALDVAIRAATGEPIAAAADVSTAGDVQAATTVTASDSQGSGTTEDVTALPQTTTTAVVGEAEVDNSGKGTSDATRSTVQAVSTGPVPTSTTVDAAAGDATAPTAASTAATQTAAASSAASTDTPLAGAQVEVVAATDGQATKAAATTQTQATDDAAATDGATQTATDATVTTSQQAQSDTGAEGDAHSGKGEAKAPSTTGASHKAEKSEASHASDTARAHAADQSAVQQVAQPEGQAAQTGVQQIDASTAADVTPDVQPTAPLAAQSSPQQTSQTVTTSTRLDAGAQLSQERVDHIAEQLATRLKLSQAAGGSEVQLQLRPRELGEVQVSLTVRQGVLTASVLVDRVDTGRLLHSNLDDLRRSLESQGLNVQQFNVDVRDGNAGSFAQLAQQRAGSEFGNGNGRGNGREGVQSIDGDSFVPGLSGDDVVTPEDHHDGQVSVLA